MTTEEYYKNKIENASIDYTLNTNPLCIAGDAFADMARQLNKNPSFIYGCKWLLNNMWIPIEEGLPEFGEKILTRCENINDNDIEFYVTIMTESGFNDIYIPFIVTHWMPIPTYTEPNP